MGREILKRWLQAVGYTTAGVMGVAVLILPLLFAVSHSPWWLVAYLFLGPTVYTILWVNEHYVELERKRRLAEKLASEQSRHQLGGRWWEWD